MQQVWHRQREHRDGLLKQVSTRILKGIAPLHEAQRRTQLNATAIGVPLAGIDLGLFTDNSGALHFLLLPIGIRDEPMALQQLNARDKPFSISIV